MIYIYRPVHIAYLQCRTRRYFYVEEIINEMSLYCISNSACYVLDNVRSFVVCCGFAA